MPGREYLGQSFVPSTDTNCWIYTYAGIRTATCQPSATAMIGQRLSSPSGRELRAAAQQANDEIDRQLQKTKSYKASRACQNRTPLCRDSQGPIARPHPRASRAH